MNNIFSGILIAAVVLTVDLGIGEASSPEKLYQSEKFDEALKIYLEQQVKDPDNLQLKYNIGSTQYRLGQYDDAFKSYTDVAASGEGDLSWQALYNMGNVAYHQGKLEDAVGFYQRTLQLNPDDEDAKYNLEFVREEIKRRLNEEKEQQDQRQNQQGDQKPQESQESQESNDKPQDSADPEKDAAKKDETGQDEKNTPEPGEEEKSEQASTQEPNAAQQPAGAQPLKSEDAERLLQGLEEDPGKFHKKKMRALNRPVPGGKDW